MLRTDTVFTYWRRSRGRPSSVSEYPSIHCCHGGRCRQPQPQFDSAAVRRCLEEYLTDGQGLLRGHVHQAKQVINRLVNGRITMTPVAANGPNRAYYAFAARGTVKPLLAGVVRNLASPEGRDISYAVRKVASPTGVRDTYEPGPGEAYELSLCGIVRRAASPLAALPNRR